MDATNASAFERKLFERIREAEAMREKETIAAITIQRLWRGYVTRKLLEEFHGEATEIQRVFRGWLGRRFVEQLRRQRQLEAEAAFYSRQAMLIQKVVRGFLSRRRPEHKYNWVRRKRLLQMAEENSEKVQRDTQAELEALEQKLSELREEKTAAAFDSFLKRNHHLVSTGAIPGVFQRTTGAVSAFGIPLDDHLRDAVAEEKLAPPRPPSRSHSRFPPINPNANGRTKPAQSQQLRAGSAERGTRMAFGASLKGVPPQPAAARTVVAPAVSRAAAPLSRGKVGQVRVLEPGRTFASVQQQQQQGGIS